MNRGNRHMDYRRSIYRRRNVRSVLIIAAILLAVLLLLFLILGNIFFKKLKAEPDVPQKETPTVQEELPYPYEAVRAVQAPLLSLDGSMDEIYERLAALASDGHTAVSVPLTNRSGTLSYHSEQATIGGYSIQGTASLSLSALSDAAHQSGIYLCGTYTLSAANEENALTRSVLLSESAAVLAEAFLYGMDDVLILVPDLPTDRQNELIRFAEDIRAFAPNAVIGLSLPESELASPDATRIDLLAKSFDYLALDLSRYGQNDPLSFAETRMSPMLYNLLRYQMRVLIPELSDQATKDAILDAVKNESIERWMTILP